MYSRHLPQPDPSQPARATTTTRNATKKHNNRLKTARGRVTYESLLHLAKQVGVELPEPYRRTFNLHTGFEAIRPLRPQRPKGHQCPQTEKTTKNGFFTVNRSNGHLAFLAFPDFSDKMVTPCGDPPSKILNDLMTAPPQGGFRTSERAGGIRIRPARAKALSPGHLPGLQAYISILSL